MANYNLTTEQEKGIALYLHISDATNYFILVDGDECFPFGGDEEEQRDIFLEEIDHTEHTESDFLQWCKDNCEAIEEYDENGSDYLVLTDDEADDKWNDSLDSYIQECIFPELPKAYMNYFDEDAWKYDAKMDGRGHSLASYDGNENEETVNDETYYIYRIN